MSAPRFAACLALVLIVVGGRARAADAPGAEPTPPAITPVAPATGAAPALEAGDTAPTAAAPAPALEATQPAFTDPGAGPLTPRPEPFYRKPWFWGGVVGLCLTAAIIGTLALGNSEAPTPRTTLGDMHAF